MGRKKNVPNKTTVTFSHILDAKGFSIPEKAFNFYQSLVDPVKEYLKLNASDRDLNMMKALFQDALEFKKLQLETLKFMAAYVHARPKEVEAKPEEVERPVDRPQAEASGLLKVIDADTRTGTEG